MRKSTSQDFRVSGRNEHGQTVIFGVFLLLIFAAYGVVIVMNMAEESSSVAYGFRAREAVYAAESGLEYAIEEIKAGMNNAGNINDLMIGGTSVDVNNVNDTLLSAVAKTSEPALTRTVELRIEVSSLPAALFYALYVSNQGNLKLEAKTTIDGDVLFNGNDLKIGKKMSFKESVIFVPRVASIQNKSGKQITRHDYMYLDEPPDDFPALDTGYYDAYIDNLYGYESVGPVINKKTKLKDFEDSVLYRDGDLEIKAQVQGPGIICASGDITVEKKVEIGPDVQMLSGGEIAFSKGSVTSGKTIASLLFARGKVELSDGARVTAAVISTGDVNLKKTVKLKGTCFVSGSLKLEGDYNIEGSVVASRISKFKGRGKIKFNQDKLNDLSIPGLSGRLRVLRRGWRES